MMRTPERLIVPTCIGCGAMGTFGTCPGGCREQRRDLVRGAAADTMSAIAAAAHRRAETFRAVAQQLAWHQPTADDYESSYRLIQQQARAALRAHPRPSSDDSALDEPAAVATTWACPECGAVDAPQPCLGICIWRPIEWVDQAVYDDERERALREANAEQMLRLLLRRIASITPRSGQWERGWRTLQAQARRQLENPTAPLRGSAPLFQ